jgi:tRNA/tmRNA/rRNA uracil-C5-methylase (TrmA/RlmC/RlmD family)
LVLDPPRKGCELSVIEMLKNSDIDKIVYVSCKPSTLARDVGLLVGTLKNVNGQIIKNDQPTNTYKVEKVIPFDMFPQTKHVETLVCLTKIK